MAIAGTATKNRASRIRVASQEEVTFDGVAAEFCRITEANNAAGRTTQWALPVGPTGHHRPLVRRFKEEGCDFSRVSTFNLDEYLDAEGQWVDSGWDMSFRGIMDRTLFSLLDDPARAIKPENIHFPDPLDCGKITRAIDACGGLDVCMLVLGLNGHIAFNEPAESEDEISVEDFGRLETRVLPLAPRTVLQNFAGREFKHMPFIPSRAVTLGMKEILSAERILMWAGTWDTHIMHRALLGPVTPLVPASYLQRHPDCTFIIPGDVVGEFC